MNRFDLATALRHFLSEDGPIGDLTSEAIFTDRQPGRARFIARHPFVCAGLNCVAPEVFLLCDQSISWSGLEDGTTAKSNDIIFTATGPVLALLRAERVALNLAQRLCGIATLTQRFVEAVAPLPVKIADTRKTTPGLRMLEKYAVRVGGGHNHRFTLSDGILIKDNHIAACGSIARAVDFVRRRVPHTLKIEVETETLQQVEECLAAGVEVIMLDNMSPDSMRQAVRLIGGRALVEASGGITLDNVRAVAESGVDIISIGALTHSAPACDISMELLTA